VVGREGGKESEIERENNEMEQNSKKKKKIEKGPTDEGSPLVPFVCLCVCVCVCVCESSGRSPLRHLGLGALPSEEKSGARAAFSPPPPFSADVCVNEPACSVTHNLMSSRLRRSSSLLLSVLLLLLLPLPLSLSREIPLPLISSKVSQPLKLLSRSLFFQRPLAQLCTVRAKCRLLKSFCLGN